MSFILLPNRGDDLEVNAWNWRPTILLLRRANLIDEKQHELMGSNGSGGELDSETAKKIAEFLSQLLSRMNSGQRMRADLTITSEPKKQLFFTPDSKLEDFDDAEIYPATYEWLVMFRDFCLTSEGFKII